MVRRLMPISLILSVPCMSNGDTSKTFLQLLRNTFIILKLCTAKFRERQITPWCFNTPSPRFKDSLSLKLTKTSNVWAGSLFT